MIILDDWQKEVIAYDGNIVLCTGRQVGKTLTMSIKAADFMLNHPNSKIIICSLTEDQAKLIIVMILDYLERNHKHLIAKGKNKPIQNKVILKNKSMCIARPVGNTGDAVRGFTGDILILDEVSRFQEMILNASKPVLLTTAGKIWMCSTPFGKKGYFYESFLNKFGRFKVWHKSCEEVIFDRKISLSWTQEKRDQALEFLEEEKKDMSELAYGQEYLGLFLDDIRQFFSDELIERACVKKRAMLVGKNYLGIDIARMGDDETTFEIVTREDNGNLRQVENIVKTKRLTTQTEQDIYDLENIYKFKGIGIDAGSGSLGVGIFDRLMQNSSTRNKTIPINNRKIIMDNEGKRAQKLWKEDLYDNLRMLMERGEILILDDDNIKQSLRSIQLDYFEKEGHSTRIRIWGRYAHIVEGLIRAAWLARKEKSLNLWVRYS